MTNYGVTLHGSLFFNEKDESRATPENGTLINVWTRMTVCMRVECGL